VTLIAKFANNKPEGACTLIIGKETQPGIEIADNKIKSSGTLRWPAKINGVQTDVLFDGSIADFKATGKLVLTANGIVVQETSLLEQEIDWDQGGLSLFESVPSINALIPEETKSEVKQDSHLESFNQQQPAIDE
jgi:hypothetical protein